MTGLLPSSSALFFCCCCCRCRFFFCLFVYLFVLFFFENGKIWVGRTTVNGEKKEMALLFSWFSSECFNLYIFKTKFGLNWLSSCLPLFYNRPADTDKRYWMLSGTPTCIPRVKVVAIGYPLSSTLTSTSNSRVGRWGSQAPL